MLPDEQTLHSMYETAKADELRSYKHRIIKSLISDSLLMLICIVLFSFHWLWLKRMDKKHISLDF